MATAQNNHNIAIYMLVYYNPVFSYADVKGVTSLRSITPLNNNIANNDIITFFLISLLSQGLCVIRINSKILLINEQPEVLAS